MPPVGRLVALGFVIWGITAEVPLGHGAAGSASLVLLVVAGTSWVVWAVPGLLGRPRAPATFVALVAMGATGGALVPFAGLALVFVGVAALGLTARWHPGVAVPATGGAWASLLIAVPASGHDMANVVSGLAISLAGAALGTSRRQSEERAKQEASVALERERAALEHSRAEVLAERNHLAREIHDVLAHSLSALSVQLEAFDAIAADEGASPAVRQHLAQSKRLVREGLDEARRAVHALRDDLPPLVELLEALCRERGATLTVVGTPRPVPSGAHLALYRVAQEALTNAVKHAPGAEVRVEVSFAGEAVTLTVRDQLVGDGRAPTTVPAAPANGGGHGLQGIRERVLLLGGQVSVGPTPGGWSVEAVVPV